MVCNCGTPWTFFLPFFGRIEQEVRRLVIYKNCNLECCSFLVHSPDSICQWNPCDCHNSSAMEDMLMILGRIVHEDKKVCCM